MNKPSIPLYSLLLTLYLLFESCSVAQNKPDSLGPKMDNIFKKYNNSTGPGCAVAIISNGNVIIKKGYGMANLEYDVPITTATIFDIASVSKQFTGLAISTLIQQGKISPEDDIHKYLPDVPQFNKVVTVRHLLHHISGLRDWPEALNMAGWRWDEVFSFEDIMRMVKYQKDLDFEPGSRYSYSNTGYNLLAAILEKVTGKSFRTWTDENIFSSLGMNNSHFLDDYTKIIKNLACSYSNSNKEFKKVPSALTAYGSSSLFTSVDDLCKWVINFQKSTDTKNPVYLRMLDEGKFNNGSLVHYGYGLGTAEDRGLRTITHTGGWAGYRTIIKNYPDQKLSIIILSNSSDFDPGSYAEQLAEIFLTATFKTGLTVTNSVKNAPTIKPDNLLMKKYTGTYLLGPGWTVTLTLENGQLMTQANGEDKFPLAAKTDSSFWIEAYGAAMIFVKDKSGEVNLLRYKNIQAKRITPWVPDPSKLDQYTGTFYSRELEAEYKISLTGNKLMIHHMRLGDFELSNDASGEDAFTGKIGSVVYSRDENQKITGFKLSGGRVKNIVFEKTN